MPATRTLADVDDVPRGATVTYAGSIRGCHGRYILTATCTCLACLQAVTKWFRDGQQGPEPTRFKLVGSPELCSPTDVLVCVGPTSIILATPESEASKQS